MINTATKRLNVAFLLRLRRD